MQEAQVPVKTSDFIISPSKFILSAIGINIVSPRTWLTYSLHIFFIFRIICALVAEILGTFLEKPGLITYQSFTSTLTVFLCPILEFVYLFFNINKLSYVFDLFFERHHIDDVHFEGYIRSTRRLNSLMCGIICFSWSILMASCLTDSITPNNWVVFRVFFRLLDLGPLANNIIAYLLLCFELLGFILIPMSTSIYLTYFNILHSTRLYVLQTLKKCSPNDALYCLNSLEDLIYVFESILSLLPLHWLFYGLFSCLIFVLSNPYMLDDHLTSIVYFCFQLAVILFILTSLLIISRKQEEVDVKVASFLKNFIGTAKTRSTKEILARIEKVLTKRVTVWHIFPIDRSLILSYIGSAITFSTLFIQIRA